MATKLQNAAKEKALSWANEGNKSGRLIKLFLILLCCLPLACRRDMYDQPRNNPLGHSDFFPDGAASRPLVSGTIPREYLDADDAFYTGKIATNLVANFPIPVTLALLARGHERYDIYCAVCHGPNGDGHGVVVQRGFPAPPSYHIDRLRQMPPGYFFDVITRGYGVMYSYASRVEPADRWAIVAYIRALQLSHDARLDDVPLDEQTILQKERP